MYCSTCLTEYKEYDVLCILAYRGHNFHVVFLDVLLKQHPTCLIGFPWCGFSNTTVQILWSLDETLDVLANEALHQGLKRYSCWPHRREWCRVMRRFFRTGAELQPHSLNCR